MKTKIDRYSKTDRHIDRHKTERKTERDRRTIDRYIDKMNGRSPANQTPEM